MPPKRKYANKATKPALKKSKSEDEKVELKKRISDLKKVVEIRTHVLDKYYFPREGAKVYQDFNCMLNKTDIGHNNNKFYVIQLIEARPIGMKESNYVVWTRWGRVGEVGQYIITGLLNNVEDALRTFKKKFTDKTGINWDQRESCPSRKGKYTVVEVLADESSDPKQQLSVSIANVKRSTKMDEQTYNLIRKIFDLSMFNHVLKALNLDTKKMPLGKLSSRQIATAFEILSDVQTAVKTGKGDLSELSSRFYTAMPHEFGRQRPPVMDTEDMVQAKFNMLNVLSDIALAHTIQKDTGGGDDTDDEVTLNYASLKCKLRWLDAAHPESKSVHKFYSTTKGRPGTLLNVWKVDREGEAQRFQPYTGGKNHKLLWHGTNIGTVAAILNSGLRIMPHSGGLVGKGVYFASQAAKSQNYTATDVEGYYVLFLAEVFLGKEHPIFKFNSAIKAPPKGFDSVVGQGTAESDPKVEEQLKLDGTCINVPHGPPKMRTFSSDFYYSEYLVYKEAQIRIRYVLLLK